MFKTPSDIETSLLAAEFSPEEARLLVAQAKPAVWLETFLVEDEDEIPLGSTKIGGRPDVPGNISWPICPPYPDAEERYHWYYIKVLDKRLKGVTEEQREAVQQDIAYRIQASANPFPLGFLAQINFAELWAAGPLDPDMPKQGLLSIFYDLAEEPLGEDLEERPAFILMFHDQTLDPLVRLETPEPLRRNPSHLPSGDFYQLLPLACRLHPCFTPVELEMSTCAGLEISRTCWYKIHQWRNKEKIYLSEGGREWTCHHIGGWPILDDPDELEKVEWVLLAQIGRDVKAYARWWRARYIWMKREDLIARRFDRALITR